MRTMMTKLAIDSDRATMTHPNSRIGVHHDAVFREITDIPDNVGDAEVLHLVTHTAFVPSYSPMRIAYAELGVGRLVSTYPHRCEE